MILQGMVLLLVLIHPLVSQTGDLVCIRACLLYTSLPKFSKDTTDRNRTSPFAFTGNKFEFRMPGSAENLSDANTILNTAVAKELKGYADELESAEDFTSAVIALVKRTIRD